MNNLVSNSSNTLVCHREDLDGSATLALSGELDLANVSLLEAHLKAVAQAELNLVVDLSGLRYIDSSGINALLVAHRTFTQIKRRMMLAAPSAMTTKILSITGVNLVVPIFQNVDGALKRFRSDGKSDQMGGSVPEHDGTRG